MLEKYLTWFRAHERVLVIALVLFVTAWGFNKWIDHDAMVKHDQAVVAQQTLAQQDAANKETAAQLAKMQAEFDANAKAAQAQIDQLQAGIKKRDTATVGKVVEVEKPKTAQQAVDDLNAAYNLPAPVTVTETGANVPTEDVQQFTVAKIESDAAKADLEDTQSQLADSQKSLTNAEGLIVGLNGQVEGLKDARTKADVACKDEIASVKADARKSKRNWFVAGYVAGFASAVALISRL